MLPRSRNSLNASSFNPAYRGETWHVVSDAEGRILWVGVELEDAIREARRTELRAFRHYVTGARPVVGGVISMTSAQEVHDLD